ncbi:type IV toxin-antitoxin system AbiEi family antitoxin domain-containing protein [Burkholderia cenocepacia]|uniref:type IV toxin-antitoxin system AbiEi family antitoxin domain-containing protein n=1 Tax=Burkholderia cenocepacia TaxID=95486 RepID=UPI0024B7B11B|nr:type IV toxin-antitoxin system AbiEi family antitoxin [Burkholderia cenocepacia]MDI9690135.1 type IV toxin-antitoxin system AbiEi family antitoxin [Burkholderia cenocepacia]
MTTPSRKVSAPTLSAKLDAEGAVRHIQTQARYFFEPAEFASLQGRDPDSPGVKKALVRLSQQGRIVLATKRPAGWLIVPPEHEHYGAPPVDWWLDDCLQRLEPDYYVALLSAARHWGSGHYALQTTQVMLSRPRPTLTAGRLRVDFFSKTNLKATPIVVERGGVASWRVSTREATLLDLVRHQSVIGGIEAVARVARDFSGALQGDALILAMDALNQVPAAQRLGFVLDRLALAKPAARVMRWLRERSGKRLTPQPLEPHYQAADGEGVEMDRDWGIRYSLRQLATLEAVK